MNTLLAPIVTKLASASAPTASKREELGTGLTLRDINGALRKCILAAQALKSAASLQVQLWHQATDSRLPRIRTAPQCRRPRVLDLVSYQDQWGCQRLAHDGETHRGGSNPDVTESAAASVSMARTLARATSERLR